MSKFRIAIVGCGDIARFTAIGCLINRKVSAIACMDIDAEKARSFAKRFHTGQPFDDYDDMLNNTDLDAVYLSVPHNLHRSMIEKATGRNIAVLCEKPISSSIEDALAICRLSRSTGVKVGINYQYRYDSGCYALINAAKAGALGEKLYGRLNVPWHRKMDYFKNSPWHASAEKSGGGTLITQASHFVDVALEAIGGEPKTAEGEVAKRVFSDIEVEDLAMGVVTISKGAMLSITSSMVAFPERPVTIEIYGSAGTGIYKGPDFPRVKFFGVKVKKKRPPIRGLHALFRSIEGFRRWATCGTPYLIPAPSALRVLSVVDALYRSARTGRRETVDDRYLEFIERSD